eukprot:maker-scaffold_8-snap-gene-10.54-mRNA-1 protein AED:0.00 eAED:0.00 QI:110/0.75/0.6/1/1/1/5/63/522
MQRNENFFAKFNLSSNSFQKKTENDNQSILKQRIRSSRHSGVVNLEGLKLETVSKEIKNLYYSDEELVNISYEKSNNSNPGWWEIEGNSFFLKELKLNDNCITNISKGAFEDLNLRTLRLNTNKISTFPEELLKLENLQKLFIHDNQLESFPDGLHFTKLTALNISCNRIQHLPVNLETELPALRVLVCNHNELKNVSRVPKSLVELNLSNNLLQMLDDEIFVDLTALHTLDLSYNQLTRIPEKLSDLEKLTFLDVRKNQIKLGTNSTLKLPKSSLLDQLLVSFNQITSLDPFFPENGPLKNLKVLDAKENKIKDFPLGVFWVDLNLLDLSLNSLQNIPFEVGYLNLNVLNLKGNLIKNFRKDKLEQKTSKVLEFFRMMDPNQRGSVKIDFLEECTKVLKTRRKQVAVEDTAPNKEVKVENKPDNPNELTDISENPTILEVKHSSELDLQDCVYKKNVEDFVSEPCPENLKAQKLSIEIKRLEDVLRNSFSLNNLKKRRIKQELNHLRVKLSEAKKVQSGEC